MEEVWDVNVFGLSGEPVLTRSHYRRLGIGRNPSGHVVCKPALDRGTKFTQVGQ